MARPFDEPSFHPTSVAATRAWASSIEGAGYPASIKYDEAGQNWNTLAAKPSSRQKGLRLPKIKSSASHGALAAARSASTPQGRLHKRGHSASETTSPITPTFASNAASTHLLQDLTIPPLIHSDTYAMGPPKINSKTKVKIKPLLRKLSSSDQNTIDLSRSAAENAGLGIHTSSGFGDSAKTSADIGQSAQGYHHRTTSGTSHISTNTTASHYKYGAQYVHPMRQTPRPYTPPIVGSFANSLESGSSASVPVDETTSHSEQPSQHFSSGPVPYAPVPSSRRIPPLHIRTNSAPRLPNTSQTNLPGTPSSLRNQTDNTDTLVAMASTRTSFESMFRKRSRANTNEDPVVRAAQVALARKEFTDRQKTKNDVQRDQDIKKAHKDAKKQARRDESQQRKSESEARKRAQSNAASEKSAIRAFQAQKEKPGGQQEGTAEAFVKRAPPKGATQTAAGAGKAATNQWQLFWFRIKTLLLKLKKKFGMASS